MKEQKGITMIMLVLTVVLMIILISATVFYGTTSTKTIKLEKIYTISYHYISEKDFRK